MRIGGLEFQLHEDGRATVRVYEQATENAPLMRTEHFTAEEWKSVAPSPKPALKKKKKGKG